MKNQHFDLALTYQGNPVRVVGEITPYYPAVMYLRNGDPGYPADGGEIEDYKIFDAAGNEIEDPDGIIIEALQDEIYEKASEAAYADQCDAADYKRESMEDR